MHAGDGLDSMAEAVAMLPALPSAAAPLDQLRVVDGRVSGGKPRTV